MLMTDAVPRIAMARWMHLMVSCIGAATGMIGAGLALGAFEGPRGLYYCGGLACADARAATIIGVGALLVGFAAILFAAWRTHPISRGRLAVLTFFWAVALFFLSFALGGPNGNLLICFDANDCGDAEAVRDMAAMLAAIPGLAFLIGLRGWHHA